MRKLTILLLLVIATLSATSGIISAQGGSHYFPETGHTVKGRFLQYWQQHGGLAQQGYPISDEVQERSDTDGKVYTVQYFERAVFELHPGNQPPNDVLLTLLGSFSYKQKYPNGAPGQHASTDKPRLFPETGMTVGSKFRTYWEQHGGLAQQGYPISNEFQEAGTDGITRTVQYFERAVFESHPENDGTPYEVLLTQLGKLRYRAPLPNIDLFSLSMVSPTEGWAVGDRGVILHYTGGRWRQVANPVQDGSLSSISMVSADDGWAVGYDNVLHYKSGVWQDASSTFPPLSNGVPSPYRHGLNSVDMVSPDTGWMVANGDVILRYSNGQWSFDYIYDNPRMTGAIVGKLKMISATEGWAGGSLDILHYQSGVWSPVYSPPTPAGQSIKAGDFGVVSSTDVWSVGRALYHYDGNTWSELPSPTSAILYSIYMVSSSDGWAVGGAGPYGGGGTILHYDGHSWLPFSIPTNNALYAVQMVSATEGWAVGEAGTILHYQNSTWSVYQQ